jgi:hypothetical protein
MDKALINDLRHPYVTQMELHVRTMWLARRAESHSMMHTRTGILWAYIVMDVTADLPCLLGAYHHCTLVALLR